MRIIRFKLSVIKKVLLLITVVILGIPVLLVSFSVFTFASYKIGEATGLIKIQEYVAGTGSMYPTFPKGTGKTKIERMAEVADIAKARRFPGGFKIGSKIFFDYKLQRGDIIAFSNEKTRGIIEKETNGQSVNSAGFIKRVIGLPGDTIEIRDGLVYLNGEVLDEPYTATARSTFGGDFLPDCAKLTIPESSVFVMGDNRKGSNDSRFDLGLVNFKDIETVIPRDELKKTWRDTSSYLSPFSKIKLNKQKYLQLLNQERAEAGAKPLKLNAKLEKSAAKRGEVILKFNDLSFEASKSGYTMEKAMNEVGYSNIVWGEAPNLGYFTEDELIENFFAFPNSKKFLVNKDYEEIGISEVEGFINGCPTQVIVQHFGGYKPPNYSKEQVDSWVKGLKSIREVQPGWIKLKDSGDFYQQNKEDLDKIISLISTRISRIEAIIAKMQANQWLTQEEKQWMEDDEKLYNEINDLADKLNRV